MKSTLLAFLFLAASSQIFGQTSKIVYGLEYSPNFTSNNNPGSFYTNVDGSYDVNTNGGFRLAHNIFLKGGYRLATDLYATAGIGYFTTREFASIDLNGQLEIGKIESDRFHSYVMAPMGIKYYMGSFFISPELGIGWNTGNSSRDHFYYLDGSEIENKSDDEINLHDVNEMTYPVFMSFGNEIKMKNCSVILGVKGYYSLNPIGNQYTNSGHYYGFGVVGGVQF